MKSNADASSKLTRRAVLAGSLAASTAVAYVALSDRFDFLDSRVAVKDSEASHLSREEVRISHLLRRAGFGLSWDEYERYLGMGLEATIDELVNFTAVDDSEAEALAKQIPINYESRGQLQSRWLVRIANTRRPLQEKMVFFWHGLLTSQLSEVRDPEAMLRQNEFFRANAFASFPEILRGITIDPAMMVYLDVAGSSREAPNENYARELMELFALGVGNYGESDVREAARAFTGWQVPRARNDEFLTLEKPVFRPQRFDSGAKTFLGHTGNFYPDDIISIVTQQPASARYIVGRLFSFFVYPEPGDKELTEFIEVYEQNGRRIGSVVEALLRSEVFYSPRAYRSLVKSPVEYAVGAIKALGRQKDVVPLVNLGNQRRIGASLAAMGQVLFEPPNVAGWPGGESWLNSSTMFARLNFINQLTAAPQGPRGEREVPGQEVTLGVPVDALAHYLPLTLDDNIPDEARQVLVDYAGGPDTALQSEKLRGLIYLILASPQFHLS